MAVNLHPDRAGQATAFTSLAPVAAGEAAALRARLEAFTAATSPLARVPGTHFGRWVVIDDFVHDGPQRDPLECPHLLFTSCLDGALDPWLRALAVLPEAQAVWAHCDGAPAPGDPAALVRYLRRSRQRTGFFVAAYGQATVPQVHAALARRERMIALAIDAQAMTPGELRQAIAQRL